MKAKKRRNGGRRQIIKNNENLSYRRPKFLEDCRAKELVSERHCYLPASAT
jgi:hypothetical protein